MSHDRDKTDVPGTMRRAAAAEAGQAAPAKLKSDKELRAERLAEALRANLRRRKQAVRPKAGAGPEETS